MYNFCISICRFLFNLLYKTEVHGKIDLPENSGYMICSNHIHMFDPIFIAMNIKRRISFMAKKELIDAPILGKILLRCDVFPVDRGKGDIGAIKTGIRILENNKIMAIFPEGTRHRDGQFRDVKKGAAFIATKAKSTIVPMRIIGNYRLFSKMTLRIGEPICVGDMNKEEVHNKIVSAIEALA